MSVEPRNSDGGPEIPSSVDDMTDEVGRRWWIAQVILASAFWGLVIFYAYTQAMPRAKYGVGFLGLAIIVYLLNEFAKKDLSRLSKLILGASGAITVFTTIYVIHEYLELITIRTGYSYWYEYPIAGVFVVTVAYLLYREYGLSFLAVLLASFVYGLYGNYAPGLFAHGGFTFERLLQIVVLDVRGLYGSLTQIVAAWIALFLLFAGLVRAYGAFDLIIQIAFKAATVVRSGITQSAVLASLIIGSINGSAAANAAMTGSFTIPLMKKAGIKSETAAGIEAVASSGGQIMPPVMGASAFVMAAILGIRYVDVIIAGLIPAFIFYVSVTVAVHYTSIGQIKSHDLKVENHIEKVKTKRELLIEGSRYFIPLFVLIYLLGVLQYTVMTSGLITVLVTIITGAVLPIVSSALFNRTEVFTTARTSIVQTLEGFRYGVEILAPIAIIVAAINAVVDILQTTGVPAVLSLSILDLSGGLLLATVLVAMGICILLGLGMPTVAAYTLVALLIAPTLVNTFLVNELAVHFFVFYAAILSGLTPPIAIAVVVASGVAEANFWRSCVEALKIAAPLYILPVTFIYHPDIVADPFHLASLFSIALTVVGAITIVHGLNYATYIENNYYLNFVFRGVFFTLGTLGMTFPNDSIRLAIIGVSIALMLVQTQYATLHSMATRVRT